MIRVVSLFCGLGGADLGLYAAAEALGIDVEVVDAIDSWPKAVEVYNANLPHPIARVADAKKMTRADLRPHDLVIGGAPCQDHSVAGKRACKCNVGGPAVERCCLADFVRLAGDAPYLMENVMPRLINAPWSEKLCAADFGDVTSRKRWFYSTHLLHVVPAPGPRRIRDIRDHDEDERVLRKRGYYTNKKAAALKIGLRGHSASASASAFEDDSVLGSLNGNAFHANEASRLVACRNPSLLEMARAHSIPDSFDWCGASKEARGQMTANSWPVGMAAAVCKAMLTSLVSERNLVA
jgi:site-specific DNA-cytosine methylase